MKNMVICFDGTWNSADAGTTETNVAILARALRARSGEILQQSLYLRGVGSTGNALQRLVDGATGNGIDENILSAYMFLCQNYEKGDDIFLFGFSRGAFSARSLSGLVAACGLLKRWSLDKVPDAWRFYRTEKKREPALFAAKAGADTHPDVPIRFLGVWDTVGALGVPSTFVNLIGRDRYQFHDTTPSKIVRTARHALAIDEQRDEFVPTFWTAATKAEAKAAGDIKQVWFAGAHADVGGGYLRRDLADIPLMWMADEAEAAGLQLDRDRVLTDGHGTQPLAPQHDSRMSWSRKDRLSPTLRRVMERDVDVPLFEKLYMPRDDRNRPLFPIGESLHHSVAKRFGHSVTTLGGDRDKTGKAAPYRPVNVPSIPD